MASGLESRLLLRAAIDDVADQLFYLKEAAHRQDLPMLVKLGGDPIPRISLENLLSWWAPRALPVTS